jgi:phosphoglycerate dehydrogenase-like enzyme
VLSFDFSAGRRIERFEWSGPGYDVALELPERGEFAARGATPEALRSPAGDAGAFLISYGFLDEHREFARAIRGEAASPIDFEYGVTFMRLVEMLLDMRSGESRPFASAISPPTLTTPRPTAVPRPQDRPAVLVLQDAAARQRMFDAGELSAIAETCRVTARDTDHWRSGVDTAQAIVTGWGGVSLNREDFERARDLALVVVAGSSLRSVDPDYLLDRGITICNTADAIAASVAEHCLALTMAALRRVPALDRQMHRGVWPPSGGSAGLRAVKQTIKKLPGIGRAKPWLKPIGRSLESLAGGGDAGVAHDLNGAVVALIGWGAIARRFAGLLAPFQCDVLCYSESADEEALRAHGVRRAALGEALGAARVVSLHRGLTERTRGMIGRRELGLIAPGAVLVNTARGELIDEAALLDRLQRRDIVCALDVFVREPLPPRHPLRKQPNAILTPHSASSTPECQRRVGRQALQIVADWRNGKPVAGITRGRLARMT